MRTKTEHTVLKTGGGKFVKVNKFPLEGLQLCAVDDQKQEKARLVQKWIAENEQNSEAKLMLALCFPFQAEYYVLKVNGDKLELEKDGDILPDNMHESHWFEKVNLGSTGHYALQSVATPRKYLCLHKIKQKHIFNLSEDIQECVQVTNVTV